MKCIVNENNMKLSFFLLSNIFHSARPERQLRGRRKSMTVKSRNSGLIALSRNIWLDVSRPLTEQTRKKKF